MLVSYVMGTGMPATDMGDLENARWAHSGTTVGIRRLGIMAPNNRDQIASLSTTGAMFGMVGGKSTVLVTMVASDRSGGVNSVMPQR